jgi:predicted Zn-dependent peptidase
MKNTVTITTLTNGLTVIVEEMPEVQSVAYDLLIPGGIVTDPEDRQGASLMLAELVTRGAGTRDSVELSNAFDALGVVHGESAGSDRFALRGSLLAEHLEEALRLVASIVREPHLPEDEIESIASVLLQDIASLGDNPARRALVELSSRYYPSPYGRPGMGTAEGIRASTVTDLRADWQRRFRPGGAVISLAGRVTVDAAVELVERTFSAWSGTAEALPPWDPLPPHRAHHIVHDSAQLQIALAYPSARVGHPLYYAAKVANGVLSGGMFGRLFIEVREKRGLCYSVFARHSASKHHGTTLVYAGTTPERAHETLEVIVRELRSVKGTVTEEELARSKANLKASLIIGEESSGSRCASNAGDWWTIGRVRSLDEVLEEINRVTTDTLDEYFEAFPSSSFTSLTLGNRSLATAEGISTYM